MESVEVNVKPKVPAASSTDKNSHTVPVTNKFKQSRYEDVWPEDVHAAFMEAVALYPPMGKRRLKYYRVSTHENERVSSANRTKSFGRCQLIQSYILEKTGKNRSRKQVSSHLQRLKKIYKDNPAMHHLFSERPEPPEHSSAPQSVARSSQDISTNISVCTRHLKSDPDLPEAISSSTLTYPLEATTFGGDLYDTSNLSTNLYDLPSFLPPQELPLQVHRQCPADTLSPSNGAHISELQDTLFFKDTVNEGFRSDPALDASAFSMSMCRLAKLPVQGRPVNTSPTSTQMHFSRAVHSPDFHPAHHWFSRSSLLDSHSCDSPLTSVQEAFYTPFFPLQLAPPEKQRLDHSLEWAWLRNSDMALYPREDSLDDIRLRYSSCPDTRVNTPGFYSSPSESDASQPPNGTYRSVASPAIASKSISNEGSVDFPRQSPKAFGELAPPLVIKPTPVYPISYTHSNIHFNCCTPAPGPFFLDYQTTAASDNLAQSVSAKTHYLMF